MENDIQATEVPVGNVNDGVQAQVTLGVIGSKTQGVELQDGDTIRGLCSRNNVTIDGRQPLVNGDHVEWDYTPVADDYVMLVQHVSGA